MSQESPYKKERDALLAKMKQRPVTKAQQEAKKKFIKSVNNTQDESTS